MAEKRMLFVFLALALLVPSAHSARISGIVWSSDRGGPEEGAAVEINTTPMQREVTEADGAYSFGLDPGTYAIQVKRVNSNHELELVESQNITVDTNGNFTLDFMIVYPEPSITVLNDTPEYEIPGAQAPAGIPAVSAPTAPAAQGGPNFSLYIPIIILMSALAVLVFLFERKRRRIPEAVQKVMAENRKEEALVAENNPKPAKGKKKPKLPEDLLEVVAVLKKNGGRMTQKDLRKEFPLSEAKVSLMITDLESRGLVRKIKQGRGNALILEEENL